VGTPSRRTTRAADDGRDERAPTVDPTPGGGVVATDGGVPAADGGPTDGLTPRTLDGDRLVLTAPAPSTLVEAVCREVAAAAGVEPATLEPLYDSVDPDALGRLFAHEPSVDRASTTVSFVHAGCEVHVDRVGRDVGVVAESLCDRR
jgi:hypothetical protein